MRSGGRDGTAGIMRILAHKHLFAASLVCLTIAAAPAHCQPTDIDVATSWGLLGQWAVQCDVPPADSKHHRMAYAIREAPNRGLDSTIERRDFEHKNVRRRTDRIEGLVLLQDGKLQWTRTYPDGTGFMETYMMDKVGRIRVFDSNQVGRSREAVDRLEAGVRDGHFKLGGQRIATQWYVRCDASTS
jgi:hypothetical protein